MTTVTCDHCKTTNEISVPADAKGKVLWECSGCAGRSLHDTGVAAPEQVVPPTQPSSTITVKNTADDPQQAHQVGGHPDPQHPQHPDHPQGHQQHQVGGQQVTADREIHVSDEAHATMGIPPAGTVVADEAVKEEPPAG